MPRTARLVSNLKIYHVMMRGINKTDIFLDSNDFKTFLYFIKKAKSKSDFEIYAYCLMNNHVHLLIRNGSEELGDIIHRIAGAYAMYFNTKYERVGHLFQNRYKSKPIIDNRQFLTNIRYILQNPVKAAIVERVEDYTWSSYESYIHDSKLNIVDKEIVLEQFPSFQAFRDFVNINNDDKCLEYDEKSSCSDRKLSEIIAAVSDISALQKMSKELRNEELKIIKQKTGASNRQLSRVLNIGRSILERIK